MKGFRSAETGPVERRAHRPSRFIVPGYAGTVRVICALCDASPDGWFEDGSPKYRGGGVDYRDRHGYEFTAACRCPVGVERHERAHLPYFDTVRNVAQWVTTPHPIIDDSGDGEGPCGALRDYGAEAARVAEEYQTGAIDSAEHDHRLSALAAKAAGVDRGNLGPTVADILGSSALRGLYFPTTMVKGTERGAAA